MAAIDVVFEKEHLDSFSINFKFMTKIEAGETVYLQIDEQTFFTSLRKMYDRFGECLGALENRAKRRG